MAIVGFLIFSKDAIFMLSHFFLTSSNSHGTLHLVFVLVDMHSAASSMWEVTKFSYSSFGVPFSDIKSIEQVSYSYGIFIANISIGK